MSTSLKGKKIALIRSASSAVSKSQYNIQEIGLAKRIAGYGCEVGVFLISDTGKTYQELVQKDPKVMVYWVAGKKIPGQQGYYRDLNRILDKEQYDLIQALDDSQITTVLTSVYCAKRGIKFVLWQGMYENYKETYKKAIQFVFDRTLLRTLRKHTKHCLAKTTSASNYLSQKGFPKAEVIPVGLELSNFKGAASIDYRAALGISSEKRILLYVGKIEPRRNPLFLMDVYEGVRKRNENVALICVGKGELLDQVHVYAAGKGLKDVYFIDAVSQNELPALYRQSDLFVLPTRYEIFGMVLLEAMYFGVPVITYAAAGPLDVIDDGKDGLIMNDFDCNRWVDAIENHLFIRHGIKTMGLAAEKKIRGAYLWDVVAERYAKVYESILDNSAVMSED